MQNKKTTKVTHKIVQIVLSHTFAFALIALLQIAFVVVLMEVFAKTGAIAYSIITLLATVVIVIVLEQDDTNPAYKLIWVLLIMLMPAVGTIFYLVWGNRHIPRRRREELKEIEQAIDKVLQQDLRVLEAVKELDKPTYCTAKYLLNCGNAPLYSAQGTQYFPLGQDFFKAFLEAIEKAEKYVFMEYFIYAEGKMMDATLKILKEKVEQGVDVRIMWDGFGSAFTISKEFKDRITACGIKTQVFSPLKVTVHLSDLALLNHRNHRKITVIDGKVAFTGGLNFADEYMNIDPPFGEWKDTSVKVEGEAVYSLTTTFLQDWDYMAGTKSDYKAYRLDYASPEELSLERGFVQPYWDTPLDGESLAENAYTNIIRYATDYIYLSTPYLILDYEMIRNLTLAAKSGVDVRILTPGIPDKPTVFLVTQSYYPVLLKAGVRIYEYTPGFNHAKMYISDDKVAIVGSANMDYRSLYLHFENCVAFYGGNVVQDAKIDTLACFEKSREITLEDTKKIHPVRKGIQVVAKVFAPLL